MKRERSGLYVDTHTYINGETAIKPYYYFRNRLLHVRYTVDRCIELSPSEAEELKRKLAENPADKQGIFSKAWSFFTDCVEKTVIHDGIKEIEERVTRKYRQQR